MNKHDVFFEALTKVSGLIPDDMPSASYRLAHDPKLQQATRDVHSVVNDHIRKGRRDALVGAVLATGALGGGYMLYKHLKNRKKKKDDLKKTAGWQIPKTIFKRGAGGVQKAIKTTGVVKRVGDAVSKITTKNKFGMG